MTKTTVEGREEQQPTIILEFKLSHAKYGTKPNCGILHEIMFDY